MKTGTRIWLIVAGALVLSGALIFLGVMTVLNWNFIGLSTRDLETNEYVIEEDFGGISVLSDTADVAFLPSEDARTRVVCLERSRERHVVTVADGVLTVKLNDTRKWYEYISFGFDFTSPKVTVYLPAGACGTLEVKSDTGDVEIPKAFSFASIDVSGSTGRVSCRASATDALKLRTSTGEILLEDVTASSVSLSVSTGAVSASRVDCAGEFSLCVSTGAATVSDVTCKRFETVGSTGGVRLTRLICSEDMRVERDTGDVSLDACDAAALFIKTDTGSVKGSLVSEKIFIAKSDTGRVEVPETTSGGKCKIETDTGDIYMTVVKK